MGVRSGIVMVAVLAFGAVLSAEDKKKHECGMAEVMCPESGNCSGMCRQICDKAGEAMVTVTTRASNACKSLPQAHQDRLAKDETLRREYVVPVVKAKVNARFAEMEKKVEHEVKQDGKVVKKVKCTFLTGDACGVCLDEMTAEVVASLEKLKKEATR